MYAVEALRFSPKLLWFLFPVLLLLIGGALRPPSTEPISGRVCNVDPANSQDDIERAIQGCPPGTVLFPANKHYELTDTIRLEHLTNRVIDGNGSTFKKVRSTPVGRAHPNFLLSRARNVTLRNLTISGTWRGSGRGKTSRRPCPIVKGTRLCNQFDHGITIAGGRNITVSDVRIENVFGDFVAVQPSEKDNPEMPAQIRIERLTGHRAAREGVFVAAVTGFWLTDSSLTDCDQSCFDAESDVPNHPLKNGHVVNNSINGSRFSAITVPDPGVNGAVDGWEIRGNQIKAPSDNCMPQIFVGYRNPDNGRFLNMVTEDNMIVTKGHGVKYVDVASGAVRNNAVTLVGDPRCGSGYGPVELQNSRRVKVSGNSSS